MGFKKKKKSRMTKGLDGSITNDNYEEICLTVKKYLDGPKHKQ